MPTDARPTTSDAAETQIVVDPDVPLVRVIRDFAAPPSRVFRAHVDPDLFVRWVGPRDTTTRLEDWDCRTGGTYRWTHISGDMEVVARGCFHEVRPSEMIVQTFAMEDMPDAVVLEWLVFADLGDGRTRLTQTSLVDSFEGRDAMVASGMEHGIREGYERLDEILAT